MAAIDSSVAGRLCGGSSGPLRDDGGILNSTVFRCQPTFLEFLRAKSTMTSIDIHTCIIGPEKWSGYCRYFVYKFVFRKTRREALFDVNAHPCRLTTKTTLLSQQILYTSTSLQNLLNAIK